MIVGWVVLVVLVNTKLTIPHNNKKIYLASKSPRRRDLLKQINVDFEVLEIDILEEVRDGEDFFSYSQRICMDKSVVAWKYLIDNNLPLMPVLTADTEVVLDDIVLGKPKDYADAFLMWQKLSGRKHLVLTTVTLKYNSFEKTVTQTSWVYFDKVSDEEIHSYLKMNNYIDKSGSYGINSYAAQFIQKIDGCFYSIMGLPLNIVRNMLKELFVVI